MTRVFLPLLAVIAVAYAAFSIMRTHPRLVKSDPPVPPPISQFEQTLAGVGLIEANTENVAIGTELAGVVAKVFVGAGREVKAGDPLFQLDDRRLAAELASRQAALAVAEAKVETVANALADTEDQFKRAQALRDSKVASADEFSRREFARKIAEGRLHEAKAEVVSARAQVHATEIDIERSTVRAPMDADVLQVKVRAGEFAPAGQTATALLTLGRLRPLHLRVDIDEHEAWRFRTSAAAVAQVRGNPEVKVTLKFVRMEPLVIPKRSLTGDSTERVDTRVLQVIYEIEAGGTALFVGQQMDVFIEAATSDPIGKMPLR